MLNESSTAQKLMIDAAVAVGYKYVPQEELPREYNDVLLESVLSEKLLQLNSDRNVDGTAFAVDAITTLNRIIRSADSIGMVSANKEFFSWIKGEHSLNHGEKGKAITARFIDFENLENNSYIVSAEVCYPYARTHQGSNAFDLVLYVNGIPIVVGEAKTPFSDEWSWYDGAYDLYHAYQKKCPKFFVPNILCVATDAISFRYASIGIEPHHYGPWKINGLKGEGTSKEVELSCRSLFRPEILLDIAKFFTMYVSFKPNELTKIICRYQQYEGANAIVDRVLEGKEKKGLIFHFQGSGKSYLMVFAAQKLRMQKALNNPSVLVVIDRTNLDDQINGDFTLAEIPNVMPIEHIKDLKRYLENESRYIYITTIHKFSKMPKNVSQRDNIIVFCDEAHRTQYGTFSTYMRAALPNAFFFGLTGTPINKSDRNTYQVFGSKKDPDYYMSRYEFKDSIRDGETLPLSFLPAKLSIKIDKEAIDEAYRELTRELPEGQRDAIANQASRAGTVLMSDPVANVICEFVAKHYVENVKPNGFKAMVVAQDRFCCVKYKEVLDKILKEMGVEKTVETAVVIDAGGKGDPLASWHLNREEENRLLKRYNEPDDPLCILIVTSKLITGFNARILQTQYLVKYLREHTLLQCITRVNRVYNEEKKMGLIVDFLGTFSDVNKALSYANVDLDGLLEDIEKIKERIPDQFAKCRAFLKDYPCKDELEVYSAIKEYYDVHTRERSSFAQEMLLLQKYWNILSPDPMLSTYMFEYLWMLRVYKFIAPKNNSRALWREFGPKTQKIIGDNIVSVDLDDHFDELVLDAGLIEKAISTKKVDDYVRKIGLGLKKRICAHPDDLIFIELGRRLENLQIKMDLNQLMSIDILNQLLELSNDYLAAVAEMKNNPHAHAKRVLTMFLEQVKTSNTSLDVIETVEELDAAIMDYKYDGWENHRKAGREMSLIITEILRKHGVYDEKVYDNALEYVRRSYIWKGEIKLD